MLGYVSLDMGGKNLEGLHIKKRKKTIKKEKNKKKELRISSLDCKSWFWQLEAWNYIKANISLLENKTSLKVTFVRRHALLMLSLFEFDC